MVRKDIKIQNPSILHSLSNIPDDENLSVDQIYNAKIMSLRNSFAATAGTNYNVNTAFKIVHSDLFTSIVSHKSL